MTLNTPKVNSALQFTTMVKRSCCYGCRDRHPQCHADCKAYAEYKAEAIRRSKARKNSVIECYAQDTRSRLFAEYGGRKTAYGKRALRNMEAKRYR